MRKPSSPAKTYVSEIDVMLPVMDGFKLCRRIGRRLRTKLGDYSSRLTTVRGKGYTFRGYGLNGRQPHAAGCACAVLPGFPAGHLERLDRRKSRRMLRAPPAPNSLPACLCWQPVQVRSDERSPKAAQIVTRLHNHERMTGRRSSRFVASIGKVRSDQQRKDFSACLMLHAHLGLNRL
jgi:hypothetical protein